MIPCSLLIENIFSKSAATLRYTILDSRITLCNTSSEAGALQSEVHIEIYDSKYMNRTKIVSKSKKISKSKFFQIFSGNHFSPRFMTPCSFRRKILPFSCFHCSDRSSSEIRKADSSGQRGRGRRRRWRGQRN